MTLEGTVQKPGCEEKRISEFGLHTKKSYSMLEHPRLGMLSVPCSSKHCRSATRNLTSVVGHSLMPSGSLRRPTAWGPTATAAAFTAGLNRPVDGGLTPGT